jgi:hypothetical protein
MPPTQPPRPRPARPRGAGGAAQTGARFFPHAGSPREKPEPETTFWQPNFAGRPAVIPVVRRLLPLLFIAALVLGFASFVWADAFRQRATQAGVTRAVYARYGPGPRITCVAQDRNRETWFCRSLRWGDDPTCRPVRVDFWGTIHISRDTPFCE